MHERAFDVPAASVGALIDSLASTRDRLWPHEQWPPMRLDAPLTVGARGGHGPVRYIVEAYEPSERVVFRFTAPAGFDGTHGFRVVRDGAGRALLRHELEMTAAGTALLTWPLFYRPLHDAVIEDALDRAELELLGAVRARRQWSPYVTLLRRLALALRGGRRGRRAPRGAARERRTS